MATNRLEINKNAYTKANTGLGPIMVEAVDCTVLVIIATTQPTKDNKNFHRIVAGDYRSFEAPTADTWVLSTLDTQTVSEVIVTEGHNTIEVTERGGIGNAVYIQDQTTAVLTVPFLKERSVVTLAADAIVGDRVINLVGGHGVVAGEVIEFATAGFSKFMQAEVVSVAVNAITLDSPVNTTYLTTDIVIAASKNLLVDGSVTAQIFSILPTAVQKGDMVRILLEIRGGPNQDLDFTKFGSDAALLNGCLLRVNNGDGTFTNLFNFKSNSDFLEQGFDHAFLQPTTGNTVGGFTARVTWGGQSKHGVVIRLDGALNESLELLIQDNLAATNNTRFHITAQGHELQGN